MTDPLTNYIRSIKAFESGNKPEAEKLLAESLGIAELTPILKDSLPKVLNSDNPNPAIGLLVARRLID